MIGFVVLLVALAMAPQWSQAQGSSAQLPDLAVGDTFTFKPEKGQAWVETITGKTADSYHSKVCLADGSKCANQVRDKAMNFLVRTDVSTDKAFRFHSPIKRLDFPLQAGKSWSGEYKMEGAENFIQTGTYSGRIVGKEKKSVGGQSMEVWIARISLEFRNDKPSWPKTFSSKGTDEIEVWYSEEAGVIVSFSSKGETIDYWTKIEKRATGSQWEMVGYQSVRKMAALQSN